MAAQNKTSWHSYEVIKFLQLDCLHQSYTNMQINYHSCKTQSLGSLGAIIPM